MEKFFQEEEDEPNDMVRRMMDLVELQQIRKQVMGKLEAHQQRIKGMFDKREKVDNFQVKDWVLKWDVVRQDKVKHGKFDSLWIVPFVIAQVDRITPSNCRIWKGKRYLMAQ